MKIVQIDDIHADAGWRNLSFLKITTDEGLVGWSEFGEGRATPGLTAVIRKFATRLKGMDPRNVSALTSMLYAQSRTTYGGIISQAIAALENACLDIKAKALGVPVHDLFGGAYRSHIPVYWSHCGTLRVRYPKLWTPIEKLDDIVLLGKEAASRGFSALKTNILRFADGKATNYQAGFGGSLGHPELNIDSDLVRDVVDLLSAFRQGAGENMKLCIDLNCNLKPDGVRRIAKAVEQFDLLWLEFDLHDPKSLSAIRSWTTTPLGSLETIYGRRNLKPYLDEDCVDVVIIDPQWNGFTESIGMASLADTYNVNVAVHNYHGQLSTLIGLQYAAVIPNLRIAEVIADDVPWVSSFFTHPIDVENGSIKLHGRVGWGTDINEDAVRAHAVEFHS